MTSDFYSDNQKFEVEMGTQVMRPELWLVLGIIVLTASSCSRRTESTDATPSTRVEFRRASWEMQPGWVKMNLTESGDTLYVSPEVVVSNQDISVAQIVRGPAGEPWVAIQLNPLATQAFAEFTTNHTGVTLAILVNGQLKAAAPIQAEIGDGRATISGQFTEEEARELVLSTATSQ